MVKADVNRDYYADLEVVPTASEEEIKKAYRSLGVFFYDMLMLAC
jgi:curved DNA-binding protein CbpA